MSDKNYVGPVPLSALYFTASFCFWFSFLLILCFLKEIIEKIFIKKAEEDKRKPADVTESRKMAVSK
ncbi:unnamed protein product [Caenorhabditis auriculariae]|uniref:Transmembrane protein n=1 Tax=Caenorhabditis auriculariae TaxID=2777116 RepID=A0A8S1H0V2_9PELO|nr:unnamed protein product [Caenorhabditis auriculariae]